MKTDEDLTLQEAFTIQFAQSSKYKLHSILKAVGIETGTLPIESDQQCCTEYPLNNK